MALSKKQKRNLSLIKKAFEKIDSNYSTKWKEWERMYSSVHSKKFLELAKEQDRNALFIPLTYSTLNIANSIFTSAFFSQGNPIDIEKVGDGDEDKKSALSVVCEYFYRKSKPYMELSKAFLSASIYGLGAVKLYWDEEKGYPVTELVPVTEVAFDTDALSKQDTKYVGYKFNQTLSDIKERFKSGFYKASRSDRDNILSGYSDNPYKRKLVREIYTKVKDGYEVFTFCEDVCLRQTKFKSCPIKYGYLLDKLPSSDTSIRENEIGAIGDSLARVIKPLNDELNLKRNQRMDLIEKHINPEVYIPTACGVDEDDITKSGGVKVCDTTNGIFYAPVTGASEFSNDVMMLKSDIEDASSINGIMRGSTNASDRRSSTALATINANSSPRLEAMIKLIHETLFEEWARDFVRLCYINASDELVMSLTESEINPLGEKGFRSELEIDIKVNFGAYINKQSKINDLISIVQMVGNNPNPAPQIMGLLEEIIKLTLGENVDAKRVLGVSNGGADGAVSQEDIQQNEQTQLPADELSDGGGERDSGKDEMLKQYDKLYRLANNQI